MEAHGDATHTNRKSDNRTNSKHSDRGSCVVAVIHRGLFAQKSHTIPKHEHTHTPRRRSSRQHVNVKRAAKTTTNGEKPCVSAHYGPVAVMAWPRDQHAHKRNENKDRANDKQKTKKKEQTNTHRDDD